MSASRAGNRLVQWLSYGLAWPFFGAFVQLRVRGREHLPRTGAYLLAANHRGPFDPFLLTLAARRWVDWVAMVELYRRPLLAWYWGAMAAIPVDRAKLGRATAATVLARLRAGRVAGIFPEGGIRADAASVLSGGPINSGACRLALAAGVPLVPVVILGSETMTQTGGWLWPRQAFKVDVIFTPPLLPPPSDDRLPAKRAAEALQLRLIAALRNACLAAASPPA